MSMTNQPPEDFVPDDEHLEVHPEVDGPEPDDTPEDPTDDVTDPYEGVELVDGVGFHDRHAEVLDDLPPDAEW
jgi:hypothetical protein